MTPQTGQRGEPAGDERAQLPGRDPAAAVLRSERARRAMDYGAIGAIIGHEISHSFDDQGAQFDATGRLRELVDAGRPRALPGRRRSAGRAVRRLPAVPRPRASTASRRSARTSPTSPGFGRVRRLAAVAARQAGRGRSGLRRRPAVLPQLRPELAAEVARAGAAPARPHRRPRAGRVPRRHRAQPRRLVRGLRREARTEALPGARRARARLVSAGRRSGRASGP